MVAFADSVRQVHRYAMAYAIGTASRVSSKIFIEHGMPIAFGIILSMGPLGRPGLPGTALSACRYEDRTSARTLSGPRQPSMSLNACRPRISSVKARPTPQRSQGELEPNSKLVPRGVPQRAPQDGLDFGGLLYEPKRSLASWGVPQATAMTT